MESTQYFFWNLIWNNDKNKEIVDTWTWKELTVDDINISLEVVSALKENTKMEVVNEKYLAADTRTWYGRYAASDSRYRTLSFLKYLLTEIKKQCKLMTENLKEKNNVEESVSEFTKIISKISTFLEAYHYISDIYKDDTLIYSAFETVRQNYADYHRGLLRNLMT
ncbi:hypothetical protein QJ857_gp0598 [Tupanvirus soda lake]|uniref:Uncharacterized protein n=2 Tax=Tupanvirus TaxID=2094720 RepID=A0A6N1NLU3_9VIRU|nr:hypothetical protein QJ857_gp0598 [Tupanvirus soda lake]QKU35445.1 hypothetical protein [Tupanvirus soda lake]